MFIKSMLFMLPLLMLGQTVLASGDPVKITSVEGITEYRLDNGLRVLLFPDQSKQTITVNVTYLVGSRHENYGETGMAHLLEHLVFKGTPNHPNIPQELTERGARPNGTTWLDRTNYFETFNATEDNLRWALDMESDRMVNSFIAKEDLDSEMTVVRNEFESGENSPFRILMQRIMSSAYMWHNYGKSTIGARSDIENVPIDRLQAFYRKYYQPDNAVLIITGRFNPDKALQMVMETFGQIPRPERELPTIYTLDPVQDGERIVTLRRVGDVQFLGAAYHAPPGPHADFAAVDVLTNILGSNPSGRLYKALVDSKKASQSFGWAFQLHDPGLMMFFAEVPKDKDLEEARRTMIATLDGVVSNPPTAEEVDRAKNELLKDIEMAFNNSERICLQLSEWIGMGDWRLMFIHRDRLREVTPEMVLDVAKNYLKPDNRTVGLFHPTEKPERADIPARPDVEALVRDYQSDKVIAEGEEFDPTPDNINRRTATHTARNGMDMALLPKQTRGESVNISFTLRHGTEASLTNRYRQVEYAGDMLDKGTSTMTREQLRQKLDQLKASVRISGSGAQTSVSIETTRPNLPEVMDLVAQMLRDPAFPEEEFEKLKQQNITSLEQSRSEPQAIASRELSRHNQPYKMGHPFYTGTIEEEIDSYTQVTLDQVRKAYQDFYGANSATFSAVGDFDAEQLQQQVERLFGDWVAKEEYVRIARPYVAPKPASLEFETPDKANAMFIAALPLQMDDKHPDYAAMVIGNFMLGGGFLNSRLATRIRQQEGLSYGVGSFFNASPLEENGSFGAYAIYAPENAEKLVKAFSEEIQKVITEGFTQEELDAARSGWLQSQTVNRAQDRALAGKLNSNLFIGRDLSFDKAMEEKIANLSIDEVNKAIARHIEPDKITMVKAGDFAKVRAQEGKP